MAADFRNPMMQSWNLNVQRDIGRNMMVMVGYFGSKGEHLRTSRNVNQLNNNVRPYPRLAATSPILPGSTLGNIQEVTSLGRSRYNALWLGFNQRFTHGLQFNASYTLSESKDTNSLSSQGIVVQDSNNIDGDYGPSDFDARHRYVLSALWELPFKGNGLKEGWQISIISQGQSGSPVNIVTGLGNTGVINTVRPDLLKPIEMVEEVGRWFNPTVCDPRIAGSCTADSVFALPFSADGAFHFGNLVRNTVIGPAFFNTDLSIIKKTRVRGDNAGAARGGVQRVQPPEPRQPRPHRQRGEHEPRPHHGHPAPHRGLGLRAPDPVRGEGAVLK